MIVTSWPLVVLRASLRIACVLALAFQAHGAGASVRSAHDFAGDVLDRELRFSVDDLRELPSAPNRLHGIRTTVLPDRIVVEPRTADDGDWSLALRFVGHGRGGASIAPGAFRPRISPDRPERAERVGAGLIEWVINERRGIEHGFTIAEPPAPLDGRPLVVALDVDGTLVPSIDEEGLNATLRDASGTTTLRYDGLVVLDADDRRVPARFRLDGRRLEVVVDDRRASYPIVIDPVLNAPDWVGEPNQINTEFGISVNSAGDLNGDGFGDIIVGAERWDGGQVNEGAIFVYHGGPTGPALTPTWAAEGNDVEGRFGVSASGAGDVNGDGFGDIVVGADNHSLVLGDEGAIFIFHGSSSGLDLNGTRPSGSPATANWTARGTLQDSNFGTRVVAAGDVNNDSFDDVLVGADEYTNGQSREGIAVVFYGSATGLDANGTRGQGTPANADWRGESNKVDSEYGLSAGSGDFNGDGYSDVVVGAWAYDQSLVNVGRVYLYLGGPGGLDPNPSWTALGNQDNGRFGYSVASAGDVNGDGFDDVLIGEDALDSPLSNEGAAYVYFGVASGLLSSAPAWSTKGGQTDAFLGEAVAGAGDVNGDGYDDILVGLSGYDDGEIDEGAARLFYGTQFGPAASAALEFQVDQAGARLGEAVAGAGDTNGDGRPDILIGASEFTRGQADEGGAFVFFGCPDEDRDGICTPVDNCPTLANVDQADGDLDGLGDTCDACLDLDVDDVCDEPTLLVGWSGNGETVHVSQGSSMQYLANTADPGLLLSWVAASFDDSGWDAGTYGVGYETGGAGALELISTPIDPASHSVYTRATFTIADVSAIENLFIGVDYDDAWAAWINGVEVFRSGELPPGNPDWNTNAIASHESSNGSQPSYDPLQDISESALPALVNGTNVLAIGAWNVAGASSDLVLVPRLSSNRPQDSTMRYVENVGSTVAVGAWQSTGYSDASWKRGSFGVGYEFGSGAETLIHTEVADFAKSVFARARFAVDPALVSTMFIGADYDDGWAAWINGVEVYRSPEMPAGPLAWNTPADVEHESSNGSAPDYGPPIDITSAAQPLLINGTNVLAIGVWNRGQPVGPDLVVAPRLSINDVGIDNCPGVFNPTQSDVDGDGLGDECDPDADADGILDDGDASGTRGDAPCSGGATASCDDNCPLTANPTQVDGDGDLLGDACDACPADPANDADGDGRCGDVDNCPLDANPDQADNEPDGIGDVCDPDDDNDGILDDGDGNGTPGDNPCTGGATNACDDNCPLVANASQSDTDSDGVGLSCDCAPSDPLLWSGPTPVSGLVIAAGGTLDWSAPVRPGAQVVRYDLLRAPDAPFASSVCLETDDTDLTASDPAAPTAGALFHYLVRVENECPTGNDSLGFDSTGTPRSAAACP